MSRISVGVPPDEVPLVQAEMQRTGLSFGRLIEREIKKDPRYIPEVTQAQTTGGDVDDVVARLGLEAVYRLCQRLKADQAILDSLKTVEPGELM
jgi:hypothetical protein